MRNIVLALALAALPFQAVASTISFNPTATDTASPIPGEGLYANGGRVIFSSSLLIPQFDPALGTLDSIDFNFFAQSHLAWDIASANPGMHEFTHRETMTLMGSTYSGGDVSDPFFIDPMFLKNGCGLGYSLTCPTFITSGLGTNGAGLRTLPLTSTLAGDLSAFVGTSFTELPVTLDTSVGSRGTSPMVASLREFQTASWSLYWTYNYTEGPTITATPEPRGAALLLVGALGISLGVKRRAVHIGRVRS